ncbi:MAG: hypothetical protein P4M11_12845 [Candidatus Pacebacteria bacterium]|nr:hypothetical protein [Candidatus Paceibacterota bacterium]
MRCEKRAKTVTIRPRTRGTDGLFSISDKDNGWTGKRKGIAADRVNPAATFKENEQTGTRESSQTGS